MLVAIIEERKHHVIMKVCKDNKLSKARSSVIDLKINDSKFHKFPYSIDIRLQYFSISQIHNTIFKFFNTQFEYILKYLQNLPNDLVSQNVVDNFLFLQNSKLYKTEIKVSLRCVCHITETAWTINKTLLQDILLN